MPCWLWKSWTYARVTLLRLLLLACTDTDTWSLDLYIQVLLCQSSNMVPKIDPQAPAPSNVNTICESRLMGVQNDRKKKQVSQPFSRPRPPEGNAQWSSPEKRSSKQSLQGPRKVVIPFGVHMVVFVIQLFTWKTPQLALGKNNAPQTIHTLTNWKLEYFNLLWFEGNCHEEVSRLRTFKSTHVGHRPNLEPLILRHGQSACWTRRHSKPNRSAPTEHRSPRSMMEDMMLSPMAKRNTRKRFVASDREDQSGATSNIW